MKSKTYYYKDEINDDFAGTNIKQKELPIDYKYFHGPFRNVLAFILYFLIVQPLVFIIQKIGFHQKIVGKEKLKKERKNGYFIYANHTRTFGDAVTPSMLAYPKKAYIIVNPDAVSIPGIKRIVEDLGAIAIPTNIKGMRNFRAAINKHAEKKHVVVIYPEAHIWKYYTKIRPFKDTSFKYPSELNKPIYTFTTTYHKKRIGFGYRTIIYVDGPFYPKNDLSVKENQKYLRDLAYETMTERSKLSTYEINEYVKIV